MGPGEVAASTLQVHPGAPGSPADGPPGGGVPWSHGYGVRVSPGVPLGPIPTGPPPPPRLSPQRISGLTVAACPSGIPPMRAITHHQSRGGMVIERGLYLSCLLRCLHIIVWEVLINHFSLGLYTISPA
jgi:hypothetical protein